MPGRCCVRTDRTRKDARTTVELMELSPCAACCGGLNSINSIFSMVLLLRPAPAGDLIPLIPYMYAGRIRAGGVPAAMVPSLQQAALRLSVGNLTKNRKSTDFPLLVRFASWETPSPACGWPISPCKGRSAGLPVVGTIAAGDGERVERLNKHSVSVNAPQPHPRPVPPREERVCSFFISSLNNYYIRNNVSVPACQGTVCRGYAPAQPWN